jgi:hypothetical protein
VRAPIVGLPRAPRAPPGSGPPSPPVRRARTWPSKAKHCPRRSSRLPDPAARAALGCHGISAQAPDPMEGQAHGGPRLPDGELDWFGSPEFWNENEFKIEEHVGSGAAGNELQHALLPAPLPVARVGSTFTGLQSAESYQVRLPRGPQPARIAVRHPARALIERRGRACRGPSTATLCRAALRPSRAPAARRRRAATTSPPTPARRRRSRRRCAPRPHRARAEVRRCARSRGRRRPRMIWNVQADRRRQHPPLVRPVGGRLGPACSLRS